MDLSKKGEMPMSGWLREEVRVHFFTWIEITFSSGSYGLEDGMLVRIYSIFGLEDEAKARYFFI